MRAVAIGTLRRGSITQLGQLAVDAHCISAGELPVAVAAQMGKILAEVARFGKFDAMSLVTGRARGMPGGFSAGRQAIGGLSEAFSTGMNTLLQPFGDETVAFSTRLGYVG